MILWLASYPKSGNTWVRTIIGQILKKNFEKDKVFKNSKKIRLYPSKADFIKFDDDFKYLIIKEDQRKKIFEKTVLNWKKSQSEINLNNEINIFKTHNMLCKLNILNDTYSFTDLENSIGVIHIVRDPRNIITSLINHFSFPNYDYALNFMINRDQTIGLAENKIPQLLSSWDNHYNSWKRFPKNNFLIKYEDLLSNPKKQIIELINYLKKFFDLNVNEFNIDQIILNSSFDNLKKLETEGFFDENSYNTNSLEIKKFFYLGSKNDWKNFLKKETSDKIEMTFKNEMNELGYI